MIVRYEVPTHLEPFLSNLPNEKVDTVLTLMLELAINKGLIDYPVSYVERTLTGLREDVVQLVRSSKLHQSSIDTKLEAHNKAIETCIQEATKMLVSEIKKMVVVSQVAPVTSSYPHSTDISLAEIELIDSYEVKDITEEIIDDDDLLEELLNNSLT